MVIFEIILWVIKIQIKKIKLGDEQWDWLENLLKTNDKDVVLIGSGFINYYYNFLFL